MLNESDLKPIQTSNDPLDSLTLEVILKRLQGYYGWKDLGEMITIRCFTHNPSISSSLKFLRRTPWARTKVEQLYIATFE
ncbi:MAG: transporter [Spirochaetes bacterium GWD1_27_9]|nr:MAG: transporter [Spirochaetes bacterium GWB1_27_13]OHD32525.1 MAG: transporter [Spirochaetes bacterium GWD1_27_9]